MKLLIAALATAGLSGCVGYVPYYGGADAYPSPYYAPGYPAAPYYGPSISFGAIIGGGGGGYHRGYRRGWSDGGHRGWRGGEHHGDRAGPR
jgi:hypothetical protein